MKKVTATIRHKVPSWNYCNLETLDLSGRIAKETCRFCVKGECLLYNTPLSVENRLICKTKACIEASAKGIAAVDTINVPALEPKELMKQTIEIYNKTLNDLLNQGYPKQTAEKAAKQYILGGK